MQKLQLSIPEPCHENWQQMTPTEQGRFCNACAKEVVDFSMMTDTEVLNYFTKITHEKVCGRALPSQLERTISQPKEPKKKLFWYWNYIVMFFMFFKGNNANAQNCAKQTTVEQLNLNKPVNLNNALAGKVGEVAVNPARVITGKITDIDGNPVSFASIKIKGTNSGVSADINGAYSLRIKAGTLLEITGAGFKLKIVATGDQSFFSTIMEKDKNQFLGEVVVATRFGKMKYGDDYSVPDKIKNVAVIKVKDDQNSKTIEKAHIIIIKNSVPDSVVTDKRGVYKLKGIKGYENYFVKVIADGYESNEFTIDERDFKDRKKEWEVLLRKQKIAGAVTRSTQKAASGKETIVRLGQVKAVSDKGSALYVVDGIITPSGIDINPDDVEDISILQPPEAIALFGGAGANGAIVITTRKTKEIKLKEVVVTSGFSIKGKMAGGISYTNTYEHSLLGDTIATVKTLFTDSIKVYPNPVQRSNDFSVQLKLKQPGSNYSFLITDATGRILLQQRFNASSKNHTEKITGDRRWAAGIYYIRVFDSKNKLISKSSFIFQ